MTLDDFAAEMSAVTERAEEGLALDCAEAAGRDFLAVLRTVTPKRTGHLMESESLDSVTGSGATAEAVVGAHARYAAFRNYGGTITARKKNRRGQYMLGTPGVGFFGRSVTQHGAHYFERAEAGSQPAIQAACREVLARYLTL